MTLCASETARTRGKRCGNVAEIRRVIDGQEWEVCELHARMIDDGKTIRLHADAEPVRSDDDTAAPVEADTGPADADGPAAPVMDADISRDLAAFPVDDGPESEPATLADAHTGASAADLEAVAAELLGEIPTIPDEGEPAADDGGAAPPPQLAVVPSSSGPWDARAVAELLDATVHPWLEASGARVPDKQAVSYFAGRAAECLNRVLSRVDPNNPWGAMVMAAVVVYGMPVTAALRNRRAAAYAAATQEDERPERPESQPQRPRRKPAAAGAVDYFDLTPVEP